MMSLDYDQRNKSAVATWLRYIGQTLNS